MDGYNSVVFAYGQTASGKTFTLVCSTAVSVHQHSELNRLSRAVLRISQESFLEPCVTCLDTLKRFVVLVIVIDCV